jgi:hypothetical protein
VCSGGKRKKDEISVDCLDFNKKILHTAWHPQVAHIYHFDRYSGFVCSVPDA